MKKMITASAIPAAMTKKNYVQDNGGPVSRYLSD